MISAILLAAGSARRFDGSQKLLAKLPHDGERLPLVRVSALGVLEAKLERVVVVLGREANAVREALALLPLAFVNNDNYASGMSSSLALGVAEATRLWPDSDGLLVALGDQPMGGTGIIERVANAFVGEGSRRTSSIVTPRFRGAPGNPVIFGRELAPELLAVTGDRGGRSVVDRDPSRVRYVDFDREPPPDIDTKNDFEVGAR
jgi:molybdenum cofactor cytidylyltransferase